MKKKYLLLKILLLLSINSYTQSTFSGVIHYESNYSSKKINNYFAIIRDSINNMKQIEEIDNLLLNSKKVESTLKFYSYKSIYAVDKKISINNHGNLAEKFSILSAGGSNKYYVNNKTKTLQILNCETLDKCFIIKSKPKKWQLTQESKMISGYLCYKATRTAKNVNIIAWYTPHINANFGPKGEFGLPGLILELENSSIVFKAIKVILNPIEAIEIEEFKNGTHVTEEVFNKKKQEVSIGLFGNTN